MKEAPAASASSALPALATLALVAALVLPSLASANEALAKAKGCLACHQIDKKAVGPSYQDVARKYATQADAEAKIASSIVKGTPVPKGVGWQREGKAALPFMPGNSTLSADEAAKLAKWILALPLSP